MRLISLLVVAVSSVPELAAQPSPGRQAIARGLASAPLGARKPDRSPAGWDDARRLDALAHAAALRLGGDHASTDYLYRRLLSDPGSWRSDVGRLAALGYGVSLQVRWRGDSALYWMRRARDDAQRVGDARTEGEALLGLATILGRRAAADSARIFMERAGRLLPPGSPGAATRLCALGLQLRTSAVRAADSVVAAGLRQAQAEGDSLTLARCKLSEAIVTESRGIQGASIGALQAAHALAIAVRDVDLRATVEQWFAYWLVTYGNSLGLAREFAESAIRRGTLVGNPLVVAWARLNLAQVSMRMGDAAAAWRIAVAAAPEFERLGDGFGLNSVLTLQAQSSVLAGRLAEGIATYARADSLFGAASGQSYTLPLKTRRAMALTQAGRLAEAQRVVDSAEAVAQAGQYRGILDADLPYVRGLIALRQGRPLNAAVHFRRFVASVGPGARNAVDGLARLGEALFLAGRGVEADSALRLARGNLRGLRARERRPSDALALMSGLRYDSDPDLGMSTVVNRLVADGDITRAFALAEAERARWLWEQRVRRRAIDSSATVIEELGDDDLDVAALVALVPRGTAVLSYKTGRGGEPTTAFVLHAEGVRAATLPPIDSLERDIARLNVLLEGDQSAQALATRLGEQLVAPVVQLLPPGVTRLRIVPDGALYHVPFDALRIAGAPLVMRYVTSVVQSVRLALAPTAPLGGRRIIAFGDPVFDSRFGLARLPASAQEAREVVRVGGGEGEVLLRRAAVPGALRARALDGVGVLHFATHARVVDHGLMDNTLYLSADGTSDGRLGAESIVRLSLPVSLIVLSGCRTVGGFVANGEGVQGLVAPLLEAGARAVVATHWNVRDRSLIELMRHFYGGMARGLPAGDALSAAKRAMIRAGASPRTWAAVSLVGDDRVRPLAPSPNERSGPAPGFAPWSRRRAAR